MTNVFLASSLCQGISAASTRTLPSKVEAVKIFPTPITIKHLKEFIVKVNYYHLFLPGIDNTMGALYHTLARKQRHLEWGIDQQAFDAIKGALASATTLSLPIRGVPLTLASNVSVGEVIEQSFNGKPLTFFLFFQQIALTS